MEDGRKVRMERIKKISVDKGIPMSEAMKLDKGNPSTSTSKKAKGGGKKSMPFMGLGKIVLCVGLGILIAAFIASAIKKADEKAIADLESK